eukprot:3726745-Amphidinium_carterae.1
MQSKTQKRTDEQHFQPSSSLAFNVVLSFQTSLSAGVSNPTQEILKEFILLVSELAHGRVRTRLGGTKRGHNVLDRQLCCGSLGSTFQ